LALDSGECTTAAHNNTMESTHPEERPKKKPRMFATEEELAEKKLESGEGTTATHTTTMESTIPEERPRKKKPRMFVDYSTPSPEPKKAPKPPPSSPPQFAETPDENYGNGNGNGNGEDADFGSFDVGMLQAVVGELSVGTLKKLKDVSGSDVQRGRQAIGSSKRVSNNE
jgi:hypothetical protein